MPLNKAFQRRIMVLDACLRRRQRNWTIEALLTEVNEKLEGMGAERISQRSLYDDLSHMTLDLDAPIEKYRQGRHVCYRYSNPDYSIRNLPVTQEEVAYQKDALEILRQLIVSKNYDNLENHLSKGLSETLEVSNRTDLCVGYFYLRGWRKIGDKIESLCGAKVFEGEDEVHRCSRLLVDMQKLPIDIIKEHFRHDDTLTMDQAQAIKLKKSLAQEFKEQLTIGTPTEADEIALRQLSRQMKSGKVVVKLRYPLHAKLCLS